MSLIYSGRNLSARGDFPSIYLKNPIYIYLLLVNNSAFKINKLFRRNFSSSKINFFLIQGDKELMEALVLDAEVTSMFHSDNTRWRKYDHTFLAINMVNICRHSLFKEKGVKLAFVATRSGLSRWEEYRNEHLEDDYEDEHTSIQEP